MNKSIIGLAALILASSALAGEPRIHTTRDSGGYEATLRLAGVPLSGGMAWGVHNQTTAPAAPVQTARKAASGPVHAAAAKAPKAG